MTTADQYERDEERKRRQGAAYNVTTADQYERDEERKRRQGAAYNVPNAGVTMQESYDAKYGKPTFGSGVPGESERQSRQSILDLRRRFAGTSGAFGQQLRGLRAGEAEAAEQHGSAMAQRAGGMSGGLRQRGFQNLLNRYRSQQAGVGAQRRSIQADLFKDVSSVRNLLDQKKFEEAVSRAAAVSKYWNNVLKEGRELNPEMLKIIEQYGIGGVK